ncbi:MAG: nucleotidyltransferase family protein [Planctomycetota bacterium]|nr:nucleotidyltransferase family protein [Planctomycetota bacterium]
MILAAGRGHRLRPVTDFIPKPLLQVAGETLLGRHLQALSSAGIRHIVINTAWLGGLIRRYTGDGTQFGVEIAISEEGDVALETGGGIHRALPLLGAQPFLLINADIWTDLDLGTVAPLQPGDLASLVLVPNPPHNPDGDFGLRADRVVDKGERLTYAGVAMLHPALFDNCDAGIFPLAPLLREAIRDGHVSGQRHDGVWFDCGAADRLDATRRYAARRRAK